MVDFLPRLLWHVTKYAVIGWRCGLSFRALQSTAGSSMTGQAATPEKINGVIALALHMRIMASDAAQTAIASPPTSAELYLLKLIQQYEMISFYSLRNGKNRHHVAKRSSRPEIKIIFSRLQYPRIAR